MNLKTVFYLLFISFSSLIFSQEKFQLSTHVLDINLGKPSENVEIKLEKKEGEKWIFIDKKLTNEKGRIGNFLNESKDNKGIYKLTFFTNDYFKRLNIESFYPYIEVIFQINDSNHYHVPITLSPFGYSTYRGS